MIAQQGQGTQLGLLWGGLVDQRLVGGGPAPWLGSPAAMLGALHSLAAGPSADLSCSHAALPAPLMGLRLVLWTGFPFNLPFQVVGITGVFWGRGSSY